MNWKGLGRSGRDLILRIHPGIHMEELWEKYGKQSG
jgi:hypothetical protein